MGYIKRTALLALTALAVTAAPASAGEVIVVGGGKAERVQDPAVPTRAEIELRVPASGRAAVASAASTRRQARASSARGRRAVYRALRRQLRRNSIGSVT